MICRAVSQRVGVGIGEYIGDYYWNRCSVDVPSDLPLEWRWR